MVVVLRIALIVVAVIVAFSFLQFLLSVYPPKFRSQTTPASFDLPFEDVRFTTKDGLTLAGWLLVKNASRPTILVSHGYPFDKGNILPVAQFLFPRFNLFFFDFRSFGKSQGRITTAGAREREDVKAAIAFLKQRKDINHTFGAYGFSLSATTFLITDAPEIKAIVADSPYTDGWGIIRALYRMFGPVKFPFVWLTGLYSKLFLGLDPASVSAVKSIKDKNIPVLLIHGDRDSQIPVEHSKEIYANADPKLTELWIVREADHGMSYAMNPEAYKRKVTGFFEKNL